MQEIISMLPWFYKGLLITLEVSIEAIILGFVLGTIVSLLRLIDFYPLQKLINVYISFIRGTPILIQIFIVFYALPRFGIDIPAFCAGVLALSLNSAAFIAEIIRGGMNMIPKGQVEAAYALGMPKYMTVRRIILPQIFVIILPQLTNEFISIIKTTPILSVITIVELTRVGQQIVGRTYQPVGIYLFVALVYLLLNVTIYISMKYLETRVANNRL